MSDPDEASPPWRQRGLRWLRDITLGLLLLAAFSLALGWVRAPDLPSEAPGFTLPDLQGEPVRLEDFAGQVVVLNFWAEWCGPCRVEIPTFSRFARNHPDVAVLGIATDGTVPRLKRVAPELGIDYPVLLADQATLEAYGIGTLPTTVVVAPDGSVRTAHTGIMWGPHLAWAAR